MTPPVAELEAGRAAIAERRWRDGYELLSAAARSAQLTAADLELLAWSAYWTEQISEAVPLLERAYAAYLAEGNTERAAAMAVQLAHEYTSVRLQRAVGNGWLARAMRLLEGEPEGPAHGYLALQRGLEALAEHDFETAYAQGEVAERIGREHGDEGLELRGRQRRAVALIYRGDVDEGKLLLNEVNAATYSGALAPYDTLVLYCNAIGTCRDVAAFARSPSRSRTSPISAKAAPAMRGAHEVSSCDASVAVDSASSSFPSYRITSALLMRQTPGNASTEYSSQYACARSVHCDASSNAATSRHVPIALQ